MDDMEVVKSTDRKHKGWNREAVGLIRSYVGKDRNDSSI